LIACIAVDTSRRPGGRRRINRFAANTADSYMLQLRRHCFVLPYQNRKGEWVASGSILSTFQSALLGRVVLSAAKGLIRKTSGELWNLWKKSGKSEYPSIRPPTHIIGPLEFFTATSAAPPQDDMASPSKCRLPKNRKIPQDEHTPGREYFRNKG
jgi:hypothetical protein